jgi:hypothetical protein
VPPAAAQLRNLPQPGQYSMYHEQARAAFMQGDTNRDGVLDAQELYGVLMRLGRVGTCHVIVQSIHELMTGSSPL